MTNIYCFLFLVFFFLGELCPYVEQIQLFSFIGLVTYSYYQQIKIHNFYQSFKRLEAFANNSPFLWYVKDTKDLTFKWTNRAFSNVFGNVVGKKIGDLLSNKNDANKMEQHSKAVIESKLPFHSVEKVRIDDVPNYWLSYKFLISNDELGGKFVDLTEQKLTEEKLKRSNNDLMKFAYVASHDLKSPLRGITNLAAWIEEDLKEGADVSEHIKKINRKILVMENLIDGLLEYSKLGNENNAIEMVDLNEIIPTISSLVKFNSLPKIKGIKVRIIQVFSNLIENAIKHHHDLPNAEIKINFKEDKRLYTFSVEDNGPGIEKQYFDKIFEIFQTLKPKDKTDSTGMGLTIVKKIIEQNKDCSIWLESTPNIGTTFYFNWPKT